MKRNNQSTDEPHYELRRITEEGEDGPPQILPLSELPPIGTKMGRRGLFGAGASLGAILSAIDEAQGQSLASKKVLRAHRSPITDVLITPDGKAAVTAARNGEIKTWSLPGGKLIKKLESFTSNPKRYDVHLSVNATGRKLAAGAGNLVAVYSQGSESYNMEYKVLTGVQQVLKAVSFSNDSSRVGIASNSVATGKPFTSIWFCELNPWRLSSAIQGYAAEVSAFAWQSWNDSLTVGYSGGVVESFSMGTRKLLSRANVRPRHGGRSRLVDISASSQRNIGIFAFSDGTASQFSLSPGKRLFDLGNLGSQITCAELLPESEKIVVGRQDGRLFFYEDSQQFEPPQLRGHNAKITKTTASRDGKLIASVDENGVAIVWEAKTGTKLCYLFDPSSNDEKTQGRTYRSRSPISSGMTSFTMPCGSPLPPGAVCTCNCVPGTYSINVPTVRPRPRPRAPVTTSGGMTCLCNKICTCIPICQALQLCHFDPLVRRMAAYLIQKKLAKSHPSYLRWVSENATGEIALAVLRLTEKKEILEVCSKRPDLDQLPGYLGCNDPVIATMAAQILMEDSAPDAAPVDSRMLHKGRTLLENAAKNPWFRRYSL